MLLVHRLHPLVKPGGEGLNVVRQPVDGLGGNPCVIRKLAAAGQPQLSKSQLLRVKDLYMQLSSLLSLSPFSG